jgi:YD repeat-containing protein
MMMTRTYDSNAFLVERSTTTGPNGAPLWTEATTDGLGRIVRTTASGVAFGKDVVTETEFDDRGNKTRTSLPHYADEPPVWRTFEYDERGRWTRDTAPDGSFTHRVYGLNEVSTYDPRGFGVKETLDAAGRVVEVVSDVAGEAIATNYEYDARGNLVGVTDAQGNEWLFGIDALGRKRWAVEPDMGLWTYSYFPSGGVAVIQDAKGQVISYEYDDLGRVSGKTVDGIGPAIVTDYVYDEYRKPYYNLGHLTTMVDAEGSAVYNYDKTGALVYSSRSIDDVVFPFEKGYDTGGRLLWTK